MQPICSVPFLCCPSDLPVWPCPLFALSAMQILPTFKIWRPKSHYKAFLSCASSHWPDFNLFLLSTSYIHTSCNMWSPLLKDSLMEVTSPAGTNYHYSFTGNPQIWPLLCHLESQLVQLDAVATQDLVQKYNWRNCWWEWSLHGQIREPQQDPPSGSPSQECQPFHTQSLLPYPSRLS